MSWAPAPPHSARHPLHEDGDPVLGHLNDLRGGLL